MTKKEFERQVELARPGILTSCARVNIDFSETINRAFDSMCREESERAADPENFEELAIGVDFRTAYARECALNLYHAVEHATYKAITRETAESVLLALYKLGSETQSFSKINICGVGEVSDNEFARIWNRIHPDEKPLTAKSEAW